MDGFETKLIEIADELARMGMGMEPFMRTAEQVQDLLDRNEANLRELDR